MQHPGAHQRLPEVHNALALAHRLVQAGRPLDALKVVAEVLRAAGLEQEANESVAKVQQALAAGSASAGAADELAGLISLISLQQEPQTHRTPPYVPSNLMDQQQQQQQYQQQQLDQQCQGSNEAGSTEMDIEGSTGPGPPAAAAASGNNPADAQLANLASRAEGASYVCQFCGGMVSVARQQAHQQLWCPALQQQPG